MSDQIKLSLVFQEYPNFYQPYIEPIVDTLGALDEVDLSLYAFMGNKNEKVNIFPSYTYRRLIERWRALIVKKGTPLNYAELQFLRNRTDVIHIQHSFLFPKILGILDLPTSNRPKVVITLRGGDTYIKPWVLDKWKRFYKDYGAKVDAFIVMSEHQKHYLIEKWNIAKQHIHVIPISFVKGVKQEPRKPNSNCICIASAFRTCWEKNIDGNLRVVKLLKESGFNVHYDVFGDGPDVGQIYYLIDKYDLRTNVKYHGRVEHATLNGLLNLSDFYLQLSHSESLGMSVIEAQSLGIPAIVSDSGGLPETIIPNKSGYCVEAHQAEAAAQHIASLWQDKHLYHDFSEQAIKFSHQNFTVTKEVQSLLKLYHQLLKQQKDE